MALSVILRPKGFIISPTEITATVLKDSSVITKTSHGLITGTVIYINSGEAIGFYYVIPISVDTFSISEFNSLAPVYTFVGNGSLTYSESVNKDLGHGWNAVHLPIQYKLKSTLWPTNSADTAQTVSSYSNDSGYIKLTCSGVLNADISELEFVKVIYTGGESEIIQVLGVYSSLIITINKAYQGGLTFESVQYYYNNYHSIIKVYAGLSSTHYFTNQKPFELVAQIECVPDTDGIITVNINEYLKKKIEILKNNLNLGTLQNNLDSFCQFYITYAESYDYSAGGYTLMQYISDYADDSEIFTGHAVNADLPFKNLHSGYLSDYLYGSLSTKLKFLTPSVTPELSPGFFFDISFVNQIGAMIRIRRECVQNGQIVKTYIDEINDYGLGIYRYEVDQSEYLEDQIYLTLEWNDYSSWIPISETKVINVNSDCYQNALNFAWLNYLSGFDWKVFKTNFNYGVDIETSKTTKKNIYTNWPKSFGAAADTINQQTERTSRQEILCRAENLTDEQVENLFRIRTSPLVQIVTSRTERRTVLVDTQSFVYLQQGEKLFNLSFKISMTDNLPTQRL